MTRIITKNIFFCIVFLVAFIPASAKKQNVIVEIETISKEAKATIPVAQPENNKSAAIPAEDTKVPHNKANPPHMEELPHIHKFHKERIKKIKKHHSKYLLLAQILIVLCHISILVIAYLHATH